MEQRSKMVPLTLRLSWCTSSPSVSAGLGTVLPGFSGTLSTLPLFLNQLTNLCSHASAEIFPLAIRSACLVVTTCFQWLGQFIVVYSTPFMMVDLKWGTFIFFAAFVFVGFFFAYFLVPETSGLTLEEMDILFSQSGSARQKRRKLDAMGITLEQNLDELSEKPASANGKHIEAI